MKLANYAFVTAIAFAMASGSAIAGEQLETIENVSQPTVMSDAELDQIVGGGAVDVIIPIWNDLGFFDDPDDQEFFSNILSKIGGHAH